MLLFWDSFLGVQKIVAAGDPARAGAKIYAQPEVKRHKMNVGSAWLPMGVQSSTLTRTASELPPDLVGSMSVNAWFRQLSIPDFKSEE